MKYKRMCAGMSLDFRFLKASQNRGATRAYVKLKDSVLATHGWALHNFTETDLFERDAWVGLLWRGERLAAGLHVAIDGAKIAHLQGVLTAAAERRHGLCVWLVSETLGRLREDLGIKTAALTVRVLPGGRVNEAAYKAFSRVGFAPREELIAPFSGTFADQHLADSLEGEDGARVYFALRMVADLAMISSASDEGQPR